MDTRDTAEQAELRRTARRLVRELAPSTVADLDDAKRCERLAAAVRDAGWLELRNDGGNGGPLAGGVEAAIVADALGAAVADVGFAGPVLAGDLARRAGRSGRDHAVVAFSSSLTDPGAVSGAITTTPLYAVDADAEHANTAYVLVRDGSECRLACVPVEGDSQGADLTRTVRVISPGAPIHVPDDQHRPITNDDLAEWTALGLALTSADLVGVMRGVLEVTLSYATERRQFGVPIGSFQSVQHLLAEAQCLLQGSISVSQYASWAVGSLGPEEARTAGRVAKAYCSRAARTVCETAVQVHGGIGNTWDCIVHVFLRRALLSSRWFGDYGEQLDELQREILGVTNGLS